MCFIIDIKKNPHDITAFCISHCTYATCVLYFSYITRMLKMIHYFFTIHYFFLLASIFIIFSVF